MDEPIIVDAPQPKPQVTDDQLKDFVVDMPEVVQDAVDAASAKAEEIKSAQEIARDAKGRPFDSKVHKVDPKTGEPIKTATGRFSKLNVPKQAQENAKAQAQVSDPNFTAASQYADFFIMSYRGFAGDEANPEPGERESLISGWQAFFAKYGNIPLEPILGLLIFHGAYIGRRASRPRTNAVLKGVGEKIKKGFSWAWGKLTGRKEKKDG